MDLNFGNEIYNGMTNALNGITEGNPLPVMLPGGTIAALAISIAREIRASLPANQPAPAAGASDGTQGSPN